MEEPVNRFSFIETQLKLVQAELAEVERDSAAASLKVIEAERAKAAQPVLMQARAERDVLEAETQEHRKAIARLKAAKDQAAKEDGYEFKLAVLAQAKELHQRIKQRLARMEELLGEITAPLHAIAPKLGEIARLGDENHRDSWQVAKATVGAKEALRHMDFAHVMRGDHLTPTLTAALSGSALLGFTRPYVQLNVLPNPGDTRYDEHRALGKLADLIARFEAELAKGEVKA